MSPPNYLTYFNTWALASDRSYKQTKYSFNGLFSRKTWVSQHQKGKTNLDLIKHEIMGWQWHQLETICKSYATRARQPHQYLISQFLEAGCSSWHPTNECQSTEYNLYNNVWKNKVMTEAVWEKTHSNTMQSISKELCLRQFGHIHRTEISRIPGQATYWIPENGKGRNGRPRHSWQSNVNGGSKRSRSYTKNFSKVAASRARRRRCVALLLRSEVSTMYGDVWYGAGVVNTNETSVIFP